MKAVVFHAHGPVENLHLEDLPEPEAGPGECLLKVKAVSLNGFDPMVLEGIPGLKTPFPMIPGADIAAEIVALGEGVDGAEWKVGDRVGIIDSDSAHLGSPVNDLGCFIAHLERHAIDGSLEAVQVERARECLLQGYLSADPAYEPNTLDKLTALNLFQLTHHPFRDRRPNWPEQTDRLLDRCEQLFKS